MITLIVIVILVLLFTLTFVLEFFSKYEIISFDKYYWSEKPTFNYHKVRMLTKEEKKEMPFHNYVSYEEKKDPKNIFAKTNELFSGQLKKCSDWLMAALIAIIVICGISYVAETHTIKKRDYLISYAEELNKEVEVIINTFIEYEEITFNKDVSLESLVITYPELRSAELVNNQLNTLKQTKESIKNYEMILLKYETIDKLFKFWK